MEGDSLFQARKTRASDSGPHRPKSNYEYLAVGGYRALYKALTSMAPDAVIEEVTQSGLRGRGGAGFPTGRKWQLLKANKGEKKYLICNADEGDPGAYMNRNEIESDPHMLLEGMLIGAYATGAKHGFCLCPGRVSPGGRAAPESHRGRRSLRYSGGPCVGNRFFF